MGQTSKEAFNTVRLIYSHPILHDSARPQPLMMAVKRQNSTAWKILEFGIDATIFLVRDADGSTPLHVAVQKEDPVLADLLLKYGPTQLLYIENCVGQTPLDIASLKGLPQLRDFGLPTPMNLPLNPDQYLRMRKNSPPFDVEKQKIEIPKLRATLDTLLANGLIVHGTKLTTELLAFADRMERRLADETARENAKDKHAKEDEQGRQVLPRSNARTYFILRDAAAARPGTRQLVHLADVQLSVRRNLAQQPGGTFVQQGQLSRVIEVEDKEVDPENQRIVELKAQSLFAWGTPRIFDPNHVNLYGEDKL